MPLPPKPMRRPEGPFYSSGLCAKRPDWTLQALWSWLNSAYAGLLAGVEVSQA